VFTNIISPPQKRKTTTRPKKEGKEAKVYPSRAQERGFSREI
jgi:hypothetical protein